MPPSQPQAPKKRKRNRYYQGRFSPKNSSKYDGDPTQIFFRSGWELALLKWCDDNPFVVQYSSEETIIPYYLINESGKKVRHRYFVDLKITFKNGNTFLIELKPKAQVSPPVKTKWKRDKTFLREILTYRKNTAKWEAASAWAKGHNLEFRIWTEDDLQRLGIKIIKPLKRR